MTNDVGVKSAELIEFLKSKRWFGDKTRDIRDATFRDVISVEWPNSNKPFAVARVDVRTDAGTSTYQLFLERGVTTILDALEDAEFRRGLADAFQQELSFEQGGVRWIAQSEGATAFVAPPRAPVTLSKAEQSNSSVIIDRAAILKLFRKLQPGVHPDVEVTRFLTIDRAFVHVPVLLGTIRFEDSQGKTVAGMLQEWVHGATDGWAYALECSRAYFAARPGTAPALPFGNEAEQLGVVTRALHETLATGESGSDFEARQATARDVRTWAERTNDMIERATRSLEKAIASKGIPGEHLEEARALTRRRPDFAQRTQDLASEIGEDAGLQTRTHGDYHLGQVIRSEAGQFLIIDFEGEPARPLGERRAHHSPLRDVAGMMRSFAYAAAVGAAAGGDAAADRASHWEKHARDWFLRGYFSSARSAPTSREERRHPPLLPQSRDNARRLMALFETEKAFYELQYELDHRPDWVRIPLQGIARLYA